MAFLDQWLEFKPSSLFFALIFLVISLKFIIRKNPIIIERKKSFNLPPSPPKLPIIGNLHQLGKNPHISLRNLAQKYGPIFCLNLGQIPTVIISSARIAKEAFKTHDLALSGRPQIVAAKYLFYNCTDMAFASYGDYWRYVRVCLGRDFSGGGGECEKRGFQKLLLHILTGVKSRVVKKVKGFDKLLDQIVADHLDAKNEKDDETLLMSCVMHRRMALVRCLSPWIM
ncbi:Psoralen synthase [Morus notabilis]|uniref:Psoralen synthase n=1 Tax=Morus notabilis TaxID=981085 RepID=W9RSN8_9ROSA|nr:Psoralen synthase [Morus notabilis]